MRNITKTFYRRDILHELNLSIKQNSLTGVIGRNGVGKTTLLQMIAGFSRPTHGHIQIFGEEPFNSLLVSANSIMIDSSITFSDKLNLLQIFQEMDRFYPNWDQSLAEKLLLYFGLNGKSKHRILSTGTKSIFNAIIGICARVPLTIFDEPTHGMDSVTRNDFYRALLKDYIAHPRTILLSSHHLEEIENLLENIVIIHHGKTIYHNSISHLQEQFVKVVGKREKMLPFLETKKVQHQK